MNFDLNQKLTFIGLIVAIVIGSGYYFYEHIFVPDPPQKMIDHIKNNQQENKSSQIVVHIEGAVRNEGVFKVSFGTRIFDLIKLAGGELASADFSSINLAETVKDGQKIIIPRKVYQDIRGSAGSVSENQDNRERNNKKININRATKEELDALPGVGPATAKKIVNARPFNSIEDLKKIPRFSKSGFEKVKDRITL
ncbi:helix-hairpin-helix domain-containing protein [Candidatus Saganbacteria bacterium]|nr:helix-hairpin-helix domain-containing protein [Candidatus Saganbacteria bacterium]